MSEALKGKVLKGAYRIERVVADGGMSVVYQARQLSLERPVVLKVLRPGFSDEDFIELFLREARISSQINHPNVVSVFDFGKTEDGIVFLAMEYLNGETLDDIVRTHNGLTLSKAMWVMEQACAGVHAAHKLDVVHRDIKPGNVMVSKISGDSTVTKILDFGISKPLAERDLKHTQLGLVIGTPGYLAPEQISGQRDIDARADIYALGAILYFMVTGRSPYKGASREIVMKKQMTEPLPPLGPALLRDPAAAALQPVIGKAMAIDREQRYASVKEMWQDLLAHVSEFQKISLLNERTAPADAPLYQFVYKGELKAGANRKETAAELKEALGFSGKQLAALFSGRPIVIRKNISRRDAGQLAAAFRRAGASGHVEEMPAVTRIMPRQDLSASLPQSLPSMGMLEPVTLAEVTTSAPPLDIPETPEPSSPATPAPPKRGMRLRMAPVVAALAVCLATLSLLYPPARYALTDLWVYSLAGEPRPRGVTHNELRLGMSAALSGSARDIGQSMRVGINAYLRSLNEQGGIHGRRLRLIDLDDGFEPARAARNARQFLDNDGRNGVFALLGTVGSPTAEAILPEVLKKKTLMFGAFSGASPLRNSPPDRYVFNYRASYREETRALIHYFVHEAQIDPTRIAVFYQRDRYGEDALAGVEAALRDYAVLPEDIIKAGYPRNTAQVDEAVATLAAQAGNIQAIILASTYAASAAFTHQMRRAGYTGKFANVSVVGARALVERLRELGQPGEGIVISQVVPPYDSYATGVLQYREALKKYYPSEKPDFVSLEGYIVAAIFTQALQQVGRYFTTEDVVAALESITELDLGIGTQVSFSLSDHQASQRVWGTVIDEKGDFVPLELLPPENLLTTDRLR